MSKIILIAFISILTPFLTLAQSDCDKSLNSSFPEMKMMEFELINAARFPFQQDEIDPTWIENPFSFYMARQPLSYELFHVVLRLYDQRYSGQTELTSFSMYLNKAGITTPVWHLSYQQARQWVFMLNVLSLEDSGLEHWIEGHVKGDYYRLPNLGEWLVALQLSQVGTVKPLQYFTYLQESRITEYIDNKESLRVGVESHGNYINPIYRAKVNFKDSRSSLAIFRIIRDAKPR